MKLNRENDIMEALEGYSNLKHYPPDLIKGYLPLNANDGDLLHTFKIEMILPERYPYCFPLVKEVGGDIEKIADRHVFTDSGRLCLGVMTEEIIQCRFGINLTWFIDNVLLPRLGEEYIVINGGNYQREYDHGINGRWQFFEKFFVLTDKSLILNFLKMTVRKVSYLKNGSLCPCGSGKKFPRCHRKKVFELDSIIQDTDSNYWSSTIFNLEISLR